FPGAVNSIPSRVGMTLDILDTDLARRDGVMKVIERASQGIAAKRQVSIRWELVNADAPADCAPEVREALTDSCRQHGFPFLEMVSRAYHDSLFVSRLRRRGCFSFLAGTATAIALMNTPRRKTLRAGRWCWPGP